MSDAAVIEYTEQKYGVPRLNEAFQSEIRELFIESVMKATKKTLR